MVGELNTPPCRRLQSRQFCQMSFKDVGVKREGGERERDIYVEENEWCLLYGAFIHIIFFYIISYVYTIPRFVCIADDTCFYIS